jgi:hypothetical protein
VATGSESEDCAELTETNAPIARQMAISNRGSDLVFCTFVLFSRMSFEWDKRAKNKI